MLGYFNRTNSKLDDSWQIFEIVLFLEIFTIVLSIVTISFWVSVILTAKNMHPNVRLINSFYYGQYLIQLCFWIIQPVFILSGAVDDRDKFSNELFTVCSYVRIIGMFFGRQSHFLSSPQTGPLSAFLTLPALVIERCFATYLVESYEKEDNACIGYSTILIQLIASAGLGIHFNRGLKTWMYLLESANHSVSQQSFLTAKSTLGHITGAILANFLAILLNKLNERVNSKYYYELDRVSYSLSERFQITENIRAAKMFNGIVWSIGFFNFIVNVCLLIDNYDVSIRIKNLASVSCDFSILIYGLIIPIIFYRQTESWKKRVAVILKVCCKTRVAPLKDTFGHEMSSQMPGEETTRYFEMLANQWK